MMHETATSIAKNTTVMMASQGVTWISSFVLMLFLPRYLGSEEYGRLYLAISLTMMFQIVIDFGGSYFIAKEVSRDRSKAAYLMANSIALRGILWIFSLASLGLISFVAGYSPLVVALIFILGFAKLWEGTGRVLVSCFQGFELMQYPSLGAIAERTFIMMTGVGALLLGADALLIAILMAISTLLSFVMNLRFSRRIIPRVPGIRWGALRDLLREGLPYFLWSVFAVMYYRVDVVMLSLMAPESVVGWYGASYRFFDVLMFLPSILSWAVFPVLSRLNRQPGTDPASVTRKSLDLVLLAGIPLSIVVCAFADEIIDLFFGLGQYGPSVILLRIFSFGLLLVYVDFILGTTLFASDRQKQWTMVALAALALNPVLNYFLIPVTQASLGNGGIGAAIATLITELFVMAMALAILPQRILSGSRVSVQLKGLVAGGLMALALWLLHGTETNWILLALFGGLVYATALFTFRALSDAEMGFLGGFFSYSNLKQTFVLHRG
ncbi:MAG: flippase [Ignavibacteriales bacterium]|nr:flippase [Ignavibacteriales bacterium]